jgi:hypothetical protein
MLDHPLNFDQSLTNQFNGKTENEILPVLSNYELRGRRVEKSVIPETKYETLTFKHFFPKLIKTYRIFDFSLRRDHKQI